MSWNLRDKCMYKREILSAHMLREIHTTYIHIHTEMPSHCFTLANVRY